MRKTRSDAKLFGQLSTEQQDQLADWLLGGVSYVRAVRLVETEFGVETSKGALANFYHSYCGLRSLERRASAANYAAQIAAEAQRTPSQFSEAAVELLKQRAFEMMASGRSTPKDVKDLLGMVMKDREQAMEAEKLKHAIRVYEEKTESAKSALLEVDKSEAGLSPETLEKIERAMRML